MLGHRNAGKWPQAFGLLPLLLLGGPVPTPYFVACFQIKISTHTRQHRRPFPTQTAARRRRIEPEDDMNRWYENVDENATPDEVFWEEMERQTVMASSSAAVEEPPTNAVPFATSSSSVNGKQSLNAINSLGSFEGSNGDGSGEEEDKPMSPKAIEATLAQYEDFQVADNWLDEQLCEHMTVQEEEEEEDIPSLEEQLDEWANTDDDDDAPEEPWDHWGEPRASGLEEDNDDDDDEETLHISKNDKRRRPSEFLFDENASNSSGANDDSEAESEQEYLERLHKLKIRSDRLERARDNPNAMAFFHRDTDRREGYDQMWVSAIDNACCKNLVGVFRNYGIQFADNFGDFQDQELYDSLATIEDVASYKARQVYQVTGLPCIASRTSFEVEPVPDLGDNIKLYANPRVISGYRFNDIGNHVDYVIDALKGVSEPHRVTRFRTCLCYFDGEMEIFDYGIADIDLVYSNSMRTYIPVAQAINEMIKTLELTFGLEYQKWLRTRVDEVVSLSTKAKIKLRDRVLKEGRVLPNDIVDVSAFMDSRVDVNLMELCAQELARLFVNQKPSKILTVATTGLVVALPMAKILQVPVVYARKERNVVMADTYVAGYSSKTVGKDRQLLVAKEHLDCDDRVLVVDDFLSSGSSQEALLRIISDAGATAVGVGVLLEKVYDSGRQSLSGFDIPIHSLCRIANVKDGVIQLMEEEGFQDM